MSKTSSSVKTAFKRQLNLVLNKYIEKNNISYEEISAKTNINIYTLKKFDKSQRLTFYCLYKILDAFGLWFEIQIKKSKNCKK